MTTPHFVPSHNHALCEELHVQALGCPATTLTEAHAFADWCVDWYCGIWTDPTGADFTNIEAAWSRWLELVKP